MRVKAMMSSYASFAWLAVAFVGLCVAVLVVAFALVPRLTAAQKVLDSAAPAFTDDRVAATRVGVSLLSQYVDLVDPLLTARGGGNKESRSLVRLIRRELGISSEQARRILRREAPRTEALTRALPLQDAARELPQLTAYLATTLSISEDELAATLEGRFPALAQALTALPIVADTWYDVPGVEGLTRVSHDKPVRTVPGLRKVLRDDLVARMVQRRQDVQRLAGSGGTGYVPYLLLAFGLGVFAYGLFQARRGTEVVPGVLSWILVVGAGVLLVALVAGGQYFPRFNGAQRVITDFEPVFAQERVKGTAIGYDTVHETILLGDPLMTRRGAARDASSLYRFVGARTGRTPGDVRRALMRRAPKTVALLDALPLTAVARELPDLRRYLAKALDASGAEAVARLRRPAPGLTRALLAVPAVTDGWNALPAATSLDGVTPLRTMPELDRYLREDLLPVLVRERDHFDTFAGADGSIDKVAVGVVLVALLLMLYGAMMLVFAARRD